VQLIREVILMDVHEAKEVLILDASGYFLDNPIDRGIGEIREDYLANKSHPDWRLLKTAFQIVISQCTEVELNEFVEERFNYAVSRLPEGARGFLTHIYKSVFETE
jgi:hypothetical protein